MKKVLILEDNAAVLRCLAEIVKNISVKTTVFTFENIKDAYECALEKTIDLFIVDIILDPKRPGDSSGLRFIENIRQINRYGLVPVIIVTSLEDERLYSYEKLHCYGFIEKPFDEERVRQLTEEALQCSGARSETKTLFFRQDGIILAVEREEIVYAESINHVLNIHTSRKDVMHIQYETIKKFLEEAVDDHDPNYFQPEEIAQIWEALEGESIKWKTMVHLFLVTGCRRGEIFGLKWDKVDWENKQVYIDCNLLYRKELGVYEDTPKTKGSVRYIRLPDQTMELLAEYHRWYKEEKFRWGDKWEDKDYLFPRENGAPMFPGYVCNWLDAFSKRHGLPHINPHAFQHTQASLLL